MSIFADPANTSKLEKIEDRALPASVPILIPTVVAGTLGLGAFVMSGGSISTVACVVIPPVTYGYQKIKNWMKARRFDREHGAIAHLIGNDRDMIAFIKIVGEKETSRQLLLALEDGQTLTNSAKKAANALLEPDQLPHADVSKFLEGRLPIDVEAMALPTPEEVEPVEINIDNYDRSYFDPNSGGSLPLAVILQSPYSSYLFIGGQRTGKSYFAAVASRELAKKGVKVFHINLASYGDEDNYYWQHATRSVTGDLSSITDPKQAQELIDQALAVVDAFWTCQDSILICDEITLAGSKHNQHTDLMDDYLRSIAGKISSLTTTGMKRRKAIWCLCPEIVAGALKDSAKSIKSLKLLYFAISPCQFEDWEGQLISFDHSLHQQIKTNWPETPMVPDDAIELLKEHQIKRIVYMGSQWLPVGTLPVIDKPVVNADPMGDLYSPRQSVFGDAADRLVNHTSTVTKAKPDLSASEITDDDEFLDIFGQALETVKDSDTALKLPQLITSKRKRQKYGERLISELSQVPNIEYSFKKSGSVTSHFFLWVDNDSESISEDD